MPERSPLLCALASVLLAAAACQDQSEGRFNVLLVSIDSLCQDRLGVYGHRPEYAPEIPVSPNIDALAGQGVVFDNAWSTTSWTLPAHAALFTGLSDRGHEVEHDAFTLDPLRRSIVQQLGAAGYATAGVFTGPYLDPKYGFARGFDEYQSGMMSPAELAGVLEDIKSRRTQQGLSTDPQQLRVFRDQVSHWDVTSPRVNAFAKRFLHDRAEDGERFFLFLHYFDAHFDYLPDNAEPGLGKKFDPDYQGSFPAEGWFFNTDVWEYPKPGTRKIGERDLGHIKAMYDAEIHWVDRHVGQVLSWVSELGLEDDTIVCILADHGDEFFEHGGVGHRSTLFPELTKIPLILKVPGQTPEGRRIAQVARIYDVASTLLDYAGVDDLAEAEGSSLRPVIDGREKAGRAALNRITGGPYVRDAWRDERYTVQRVFDLDQQASQRRGELVVRTAHNPDGRPFLRVFDRSSDPMELRPLPPTHPEYRNAVRSFREAFLASESHAASLRHSDPELRYAPPMSEEERRMLDELGYAEGSMEVQNSAGRRPFMAPFPEPRVN